MTWRITALLSLLVFPGCLAHERAPDVDGGALAVADAAPVADASVLVNDAWVDAWRPGDSDAGPAVCAASTLAIGVRIEAITPETARCMFTHADGAYLTGVEPAPADAGIRIHFDLCPAADADCRCDVIVSNVGTDLASQLGPDSNVSLDVYAGEGFFPGALIAITKVPSCQCDGCGCSEPLYLYATTGPSDFAQHVPMPMAFSRGASVCPTTGCDFGGTWMLHARGDAGEIDVPGGTTRDVGSVHVRSVRDVEIWEPCAACATCGTPVGAWVAWVSS